MVSAGVWCDPCDVYVRTIVHGIALLMRISPVLLSLRYITIVSLEYLEYILVTTHFTVHQSLGHGAAMLSFSGARS